MRQKRKCLLMHARQLYDFSVGWELDITGNEPVAQHLYKSLDIFPRYERMYLSWSDGNPKQATLSAYDLYFVVIGLARYARASRDQGVWTEALELFLQINLFFDDRSFARFGCFPTYNTVTKHFGYQKSGNTFLHRLEALVTLLLTAKTLQSPREWIQTVARLKPVQDELVMLFNTHIMSRRLKCTVEGFTRSMTMSAQQQRSYLTNAHPLEWVGFFIELSWILEQPLPIAPTTARLLVDAAYDRSYTTTGCFANNYYLRSRRSRPNAGFWAQTEAILGFVYAARFFRNKKYEQRAAELYAFYDQYFIDSQYGGIFSDVSVDGTVINKNKGYEMKCDYHSIRMAEKWLLFG